MTRLAKDVLPADVLRAMLCDLAPQAPTAAAAARVKRNTLRQVASSPHVVTHETGWRPFVDKAEMKVLFDDGVSRSWLVRLAPGGELPPHGHDESDEECVVLEGEVWVNGLRYGAGDYTAALRGSTHHSVRTVSGALFFLRSASPLKHMSRTHSALSFRARGEESQRRETPRSLASLGMTKCVLSGSAD